MTFVGSSTLARRGKPSRGQPPTEQPQGPRAAVFHPEFREDLRSWIESDRRIALRVLELVEAALGEPFAGIGKPEPLKHELTGAGSRRITGEHRLVYLVRGDRVEFLQARYHF
jgi:toxin YoeB